MTIKIQFYRLFLRLYSNKQSNQNFSTKYYRTSIRIISTNCYHIKKYFFFIYLYISTIYTVSWTQKLLEIFLFLKLTKTQFLLNVPQKSPHAHFRADFHIQNNPIFLVCILIPSIFVI